MLTDVLIYSAAQLQECLTNLLTYLLTYRDCMCTWYFYKLFVGDQWF